MNQNPLDQTHLPLDQFTEKTLKFLETQQEADGIDLLLNHKKDVNNLLKSPLFAVFKAYGTLPLEPQAQAEAQKKLFKEQAEEQGQLYTQDDLDSMFAAPLSRQQTYEVWKEGDAVYSSRHLHAMLQTSYSYSIWKAVKHLPEFFTYEEAYWVYESLRRDKATKWLPSANVVPFNPRNYQHPFPLGNGNKVASKIGKVYGTWQLLECLSETENTSHNNQVQYRARCIACGFEQPKISYRSLTIPCKSCIRIARAEEDEKPLKRDARLPKPILVWKCSDGTWKLGPKKPEDAIGRIKFTHVNEPFSLKNLTEAEELDEEDTIAEQPAAKPKAHKGSAAVDGMLNDMPL